MCHTKDSISPPLKQQSRRFATVEDSPLPGEARVHVYPGAGLTAGTRAAIDEHPFVRFIVGGLFLEKASRVVPRHFDQETLRWSISTANYLRVYCCSTLQAGAAERHSDFVDLCINAPAPRLMVLMAPDHHWALKWLPYLKAWIRPGTRIRVWDPIPALRNFELFSFDDRGLA